MAKPSALDTATPAEPLRPPTTFGFKDVFTCINIIGGVLAIVFCIEGQLRYAAYAFLLGYMLGDSLDGYVARKTGTGNRFGAEFDAASDSFTQCIVPAFMLYVAYRDWSPYLGGALAGVLIISGLIRQARSAVTPVTFESAYIGMPRTVSAIIIISYLNSAFIPQLPGWLWIGIPLTLFVSVAHLLPIPFRTHKGRRLKRTTKIWISGFFIMTIMTLVIAREYVFDVTLGWLVAYSFIGWTELTRDELREFHVQARAWSRAVREAR